MGIGGPSRTVCFWLEPPWGHQASPAQTQLGSAFWEWFTATRQRVRARIEPLRQIGSCAR